MRDLALILRTCNPQWHNQPPRRQQPVLPAGKRECTCCRSVKDEVEFYFINKLRKDGTKPRRSLCKSCEVLRVVEGRHA